ncbi:MAG: hypothetical protein WBC86_08980, partial [Pseudolabrys sp.]
MKPLMVAALLSAFSTVALAKTASIERLPDIYKNMVSQSKTETHTVHASHVGSFPGQTSARHCSRHDCARRTFSNRRGSKRQGKAFTGDCGGSKYSRSRIAPIEP